MKKITSLFERIPFFYFLVPVFLFLHIENEYRHLINYHFVYFEIIQLVIAALLIFLLSLLFFREIGKASIFAFIFLVVYYYFCDLKDYLHFNHHGFFSSYLFLFPFVFLMFILLFILIRKSKSGFRRSFLYLNTLLVVLVAWEGISFLGGISKNNVDLGDLKKEFSSHYQSCSSCKKPDIYYFLFDGYTSSGVLLSEFEYKNPIDRYLTGKGFYVIPHSESNYNLTPFSMGSVFNLDYLRGLNSTQQFFIKDYLPGVATVYYSELFPVLQKEGYKIYNHSIFDFDKIPASVRPYDLWEVNQIFARHNIFWKMDYDIGWLVRRKLNIQGHAASQQAYVNAKDKHLAQTFLNTMTTIHSSDVEPKFVYSHFVLPHGPYSFDSVGNRYPAKPFPLSWDEYKSGYLGQVKYTNRIIEALVDSISKRKERPSIIIIQGDHGFRFSQPGKESLQFSNFNAIFFPEGDYRLINDTMTNVNTFRIVLNGYFQQHLPMLGDTTIFLHYH